MIAGCQWMKYANTFGISKDTIYKWIDKHGMPAHRMGRLWKFKKKDQVDVWVEAGGAAASTEQEDGE